MGKGGFGRAVSRILSSLLRAERIICLSSRYPEPVPRWRDRSGPLQGSLFGLAPDGVFRAASLALRAVRSCRTFSPSPTVAAVYDRRFNFGSLFSVALSVGKSLDFPPACIPVGRRSGTAATRLRGIAPFGVRTFLPALLEAYWFAGATAGRAVSGQPWSINFKKGRAILRPSKTTETITDRCKISSREFPAGRHRARVRIDIGCFKRITYPWVP